MELTTFLRSTSKEVIFPFLPFPVLLHSNIPLISYLIGVVTLIPWNHTIQTVDPELVPLEPVYTRPQRFAIGDCLINHHKESEYFGVWDMDEFAVLSPNFTDIQAFVSSFLLPFFFTSSFLLPLLFPSPLSFFYYLFFFLFSFYF